jgi:L-lactate dehydrogenase complex protein LldG
LLIDRSVTFGEKESHEGACNRFVLVIVLVLEREGSQPARHSLPSILLDLHAWATSDTRDPRRSRIRRRQAPEDNAQGVQQAMSDRLCALPITGWSAHSRTSTSARTSIHDEHEDGVDHLFPPPMTSREQILGRIREAMRYPAKHPSPGHGLAASVEKVLGFRQWLPQIPEERSERITMFERQSADLKTNFLRCADLAAAAQRLAEIAKAEGWKLIAHQPNALLAGLIRDLGISTLEVNASTATTDLEKAVAGITLCDALVAQTGGVLLTTRSAGGRALSVLPPHHVVVANESQLLPDLPAAFDLLHQRYGGKFPSFCTFITGPSRTSDIERMLVLGAHGPKKLTILLVAGESWSNATA